MGNYRSEYEKYYKNINNPNKNKENNKYISPKTRSKDIEVNKQPNYGINKFLSIEYWYKREIKNFTGALAILVLFSGLKYGNFGQTKDSYLWCKNLLFTDFNYDETIEYIEQLDFGTFKGKDLKIGNFTIESLKYENLKNQLINSKKYIENNLENFMKNVQNTGKEEK